MWKIKVSSVLSLVVNGEIHKEPNKARRDFFFQTYVKSRNGSNMIFFRIHRDPLDHWSVKSHTTGLNFSSILTKQCASFNPTHWYLNSPLDQTHPFLKGFYYILVFVYTHDTSLNLGDPQGNQYLIDQFFSLHQTQVQGKGDPFRWAWWQHLSSCS